MPYVTGACDSGHRPKTTKLACVCNAGTRAVSPKTTRMDSYLDVAGLTNPTAGDEFGDFAEPNRTIALGILLFTFTPNADSLISKLLSDRIMVQAYFKSPSGAEARISGFVDSKTVKGGILISTSEPPLIPELGYLVSRPFDSACDIWYGEKRELPEEHKNITDTYGESFLSFNFRAFNDWFALHFTI